MPALVLPSQPQRQAPGKLSGSTILLPVPIQLESHKRNSCRWAEEQDHVTMFPHMENFSLTLDVLGFKDVAVMFLAWRNITI